MILKHCISGFFSGYRRFQLCVLGAFVVAFSLAPVHGQDFELENLRCELLRNPLGLDVLNPSFSWELQSPEKGKKQIAYQILVSDDSMKLRNNQGDWWNTGKVKSGETNHIVYKGAGLRSGQYYFWKIKVWDEKNRESGWSEIQYWSMGLLSRSDWKAKWIGVDSINPATDFDRYIIPPSPLLRKAFKIQKEVKRATLFASALGLYEIHLNGNRVGDHILAPEWTDYTKRVQYQTYDVTSLLTPSENAIGAVLADGWYAGDLWDHFYRGRYGFYPKLLAQLHIEYGDGSTETIVSDETWKLFKDGPIKEASIFDGEVFDERDNPKDWMMPGFKDDRWTNATVYSPSVTLNAQMNEAVKVVREVKPVNIFELTKFKYRPKTYIIDMGQNMAGWISLKLPYNPGRKITIRYAEMLNDDSTLYVENLRHAKSRDIYIPAREEQVFYEPKFTYHGFRYVEITGLSKAPGLSEVTGKVVASSAPVVSYLETSNKDLNQLWSNIFWTQLGNIPGVPTDCPQRDERSGWMGDAQVFAQTAMFNMDMEAFYKKWFRDIRDEQTADGRFPNYAPHITQSLRYYDAPGWADAGVIIPWKAYINYGDKKILRSNYEAMCKFIDRVYKMNPDLIRINEVGQNYGDWLNGNSIKAADYPKDGGAIPKDVFSTAYFAYSTALLAKASSILNKNKEYKHYDSLAKAIRQAFINNFISKDGIIKGNTQAGYGMALEFGLVPEALKAKVVSNMVQAVKDYDGRISTGIHTTERFMNQLSLNGHPEIAYSLLGSHRFPSWIYSIDQGATTIWERWDGYVKGRGFQDPGMNSFNHYAIGAVGEWMYKHILGISPDENNPGYRHFYIEPKPGGTLTWAKGYYHSIVGRIGVSWKQEGNRYVYEIEVPTNSSATLTLPTDSNILEGGAPAAKASGVRLLEKKNGNTRFRLASGKYTFQYE